MRCGVPCGIPLSRTRPRSVRVPSRLVRKARSNVRLAIGQASPLMGLCMTSFRQRNEVGFLGHMCEPAGLPVLLGLFDALPARGDEIPPDITWPFPRGAAEKHHIRRSDRRDGDAIAGAKDQKARRLIPLMRNLDFAFDEKARALFMIGIARRARTGNEI